MSDTPETTEAHTADEVLAACDAVIQARRTLLACTAELEAAEAARKIASHAYEIAHEVRYDAMQDLARLLDMRA